MSLTNVVESLEGNEQSIIVIMCATVIIVVLGVATLMLKSRKKLNWYEQNVLELGNGAEFVRCHPLTRTDTEDTARMEGSTISTGSFKNSPGLPMPEGDLSNLFTIPKAKKGPRSMFSKFHQNQFDRGLYHNTMGDESACSPVQMKATGSIQLAVSHDVNLNLLTVSLKQAVHLPTKREDDLPNPFMKVTLEIPESKVPNVEHVTKTYPSTASPQINEDFYFPVTAQQISACRLEIMVYDYDQFSVDECVGFCYLALGKVNSKFEHDEITVFWAEVLPHDDGGNKGFGEVSFSLTYLATAQRLSMNIFKVRNIRTRHEGNVALRVTLFKESEKILKKKKTNSKKMSRTIQYNECLTFTLPKHSLCDVILSAELILETGTFGIASRTLAQMQLPLHKCKDLWRGIIREQKSQARWYSFEQP